MTREIFAVSWSFRASLSLTICFFPSSSVLMVINLFISATPQNYISKLLAVISRRLIILYRQGCYPRDLCRVVYSNLDSRLLWCTVQSSLRPVFCTVALACLLCGHEGKTCTVIHLDGNGNARSQIQDFFSVNARDSLVSW